MAFKAQPNLQSQFALFSPIKLENKLSIIKFLTFRYSPDCLNLNRQKEKNRRANLCWTQLESFYHRKMIYFLVWSASTVMFMQFEQQQLRGFENQELVEYSFQRFSLKFDRNAQKLCRFWLGQKLSLTPFNLLRNWQTSPASTHRIQANLISLALLFRKQHIKSPSINNFPLQLQQNKISNDIKFNRFCVQTACREESSFVGLYTKDGWLEFVRMIFMDFYNFKHQLINYQHYFIQEDTSNYPIYAHLIITVPLMNKIGCLQFMNSIHFPIFANTIAFQLIISKIKILKKTATKMQTDLQQQIKNIKLIGYHFITDNISKFNNRLIYILLQNLVEHYHTNNYLRVIMMQNQSLTLQYVGEIIELFMQEKIQGNIGRVRGNGMQLDNYQQSKRKYKQKDEINLLQAEKEKMKGQIQKLRTQLQTQSRKVRKVVAKYNAMAELTYELKVKHKQELKKMQEQYSELFQQIDQNKKILNDKLIRLTYQLQYLKEQKNSNKKQKNHTQSIASQTQNQQLNIINKETLGMQTQISITIRPKQNQNKIQNRVVDIQIVNNKKLNIKSKQEINVVVAAQQPLKQQLTDSCSKSLMLYNNQTQTQLYDEPYFTKLINRNEQQQHFQTEESLQQLQSQLITVKCLNSYYFSKHTELKLQKQQKQSQVIKLTQYYNHLHDRYQLLSEQFDNQQNQLAAALQTNQDQMTLLLRQKQQLQESVIFLQSKVQEITTKPELSMTNSNVSQKTQVSRTPKNINKIFQSSHQTYHSSEKQPSQNSNQYIRKKTIGKYILQMLDTSTRGETKTIMLKQIGECLGWTKQEIMKVEGHQRKTAGSQEQRQQLSEFQLWPNFQQKIYLFLTNQSQSQQI